ncbi:Aminoglycoside phosphotransferase [Penicillium herquei]|nr:Aminoglycoside phosphotransferase [Penicillium herquei]
MEKDNSEEGEILHSLFARKIVRISESLVVKKGPDLRAHEVSNLRFVAANTTIPVPKVHDVQYENGKVTAITMDYMPGKRLDELSVTEQLRGYITQLRNLKGTYIGGADGGTAITGKYISIEGGPFESERMFNKWILEDLAPGLPGIYQHFAEHALTDDHEIFFTHSDFATRNILVDHSDSGKCQVTAILDWEWSGWYPEYWEYYKAYRNLLPLPDWPDYLIHIFPPSLRLIKGKKK